jgi:predicted enzyme related to lactoylglutathione lyase
MSEVPAREEMAGRHEARPRPRLCYVEIPAVDVHQSAAFYENVFGWGIRGRDTDRPQFDYPSADVTGAWVTGRAVAREPGLLLYIWVDQIDDTLTQIALHGGATVEPPHSHAPGGEWIATFRDPAGNVLGLYQEGSR